MEQLVARRAHNPKVVSSSLAPATKEKLRFNHELELFLCGKVNEDGFLENINRAVRCCFSSRLIQMPDKVKDQTIGETDRNYGPD